MAPVRSQSALAALRERRVLVTGASSGLGRVLAMRLGELSARVLLVARREDELQRVQEEVAAGGGTAVAFPADLRDADEIARLVTEVESRFDGIDVLINNAGLGVRREVVDSFARFDDVERTLNLNYIAAVRLIYGFLPKMIEQGRGHIVNSNSVSVLVPIPRFSAYAASKAALGAFSECLAVELIGSGIDVTNLYLPLLDTPMIEKTEAYQSEHLRRTRLVTPEAAAEKIVRTLIERPTRATFGYWKGELVRFVMPAFTRRNLNRVFRSFSSKTVPEPDDDSFARKIRRVWKVPPL